MAKNKKQAGEPPASREEISNLTLAEAVKILRENGCESLTVAGLKRQIAAGAPTNADGTIDLVDYAAWLCYCSKRE